MEQQLNRSVGFQGGRAVSISDSYDIFLKPSIMVYQLNMLHQSPLNMHIIYKEFQLELKTVK